MKNIFVGFWSIGLFCFSSACSNTEKPLTSKKFSLSNEELITLLDLLEADENSLMNFHILCSEHFNDSAVELRVYENPQLPSKKLGVCNTSRYKRSNVFVYDSACVSKLPDSLLSPDNRSPFFIPDAPQWTVLAKKRQQKVSYSKISLFLIYSDTLSNPFPELIPGQ
jgi:hypothetical protein